MKARSRAPEIEAALAHLHRQPHILDDTQLRKQVGDLKRLGDAHARELMLRHACDVLTIEQHRATRGSKCAGQDIEKSALASAVRANDGGQLACLKPGIDIAQGGEFAERLANATGLEQRQLSCGPLEDPDDPAPHALREEQHATHEDDAKRTLPIARHVGETVF